MMCGSYYVRTDGTSRGKDDGGRVAVIGRSRAEAHSHRVDARIRQDFADHMVGARSQLRVAARAGGELAPVASLFAGTCETEAVLLTYSQGAPEAAHHSRACLSAAAVVNQCASGQHVRAAAIAVRTIQDYRFRSGGVSCHQVCNAGQRAPRMSGAALQCTFRRQSSRKLLLQPAGVSPKLLECQQRGRCVMGRMPGGQPASRPLSQNVAWRPGLRALYSTTA